MFLFIRYLEYPKIQGIYFEIQGTYFKICALSFLQNALSFFARWETLFFLPVIFTFLARKPQS